MVVVCQFPRAKYRKPELLQFMFDKEKTKTRETDFLKIMEVTTLNLSFRDTFNFVISIGVTMYTIAKLFQ